MGFFDFFRDKKEDRTEDSSTGSNESTSITSLYGASTLVSEDSVMKIPTVKSCFDLIGGTIAQLPIYLYRETEEGSIERVPNDYRERLLNDEPNEFQTAYSLKLSMVKDYLFYGVTYNHLEKEGNTILEIINLPAQNVKVDKYIQNGYKVVDADINLIAIKEGRIVRDKNGSAKLMQKFKPYECVIALNDSSDGLTAKGALHYGADVFKIALEEKVYTSSIYKNGALPLGVLKTATRLSEEVLKRLKESWRSLYVGSENAGKTVILEEGLDYKPVSLKPGDLLLTENRKDTVSDICKLFNLPESLIDVTKIKYGSLEQNNIHFLQYTLSPILTSLENGINKCMLLEDEKEKGYFFAFDTSEVLRSTDKEKYESVKVALDGGIMSINEARYKLNLPGIKDDIMKWSLGAVLYYPATGEMKIPNMGIGIPGYEGKGVNVNNLNEKFNNEVDKIDEETGIDKKEDAVE